MGQIIPVGFFFTAKNAKWRQGDHGIIFTTKDTTENEGEQKETSADDADCADFLVVKVQVFVSEE